MPKNASHDIMFDFCFPQCPNTNIKTSFLLTCPVNLLIRLAVRKYFQLLVNGALLKRGIVMEDQYHSSYEEMIKNTAAIL